MSYRDKLYSTYVSSNIAHIFGEANIKKIEKQQFPSWGKHYSKLLPDNKHASIIDIGCGSGSFVYFLKKLGYENTSGIDISPEQIQVAKNLGLTDVECSDNIIYLKGKQNAYDVVIIKDLIEHYPKESIMELLDLVFDALKPGGKVIIQTPNAESPFGSRFRYYDFTHSVAFTKSSLSQVLRATGYENVSFYAMGPVPHGIKSFIRFLLWKIILIIIKLYMLIETGSADGIYTQTIIAVGQKEKK
ncbi:MAG: class I SAM-dependent methyltransferase [Candidatus Schekmanbacteria bacterium]|nr:class I SAM-dependent methyltransferase [Candidatus Schekmanbacteria bacterium]